MRRVLLDVRDPDGRDAFLALAAGADVVVESFRPGVVDRLGIGYEAVRAVNTRRRLLLDERVRPGRPAARRGPATTSTTWPWAATWPPRGPRADGGPPIPGATIADAAGGGMHAALAVCAALAGRATTGEGTFLDVSVADGVLWLMSLAADEHLATGSEPGPGHDVLTGRYACYDTYRAADGKWLAVAAIEAKFFANLCRALECEQWIEHQYDDDVQDDVRRDSRRRLRPARPRRLGGRALGGRHLCGPGPGRVRDRGRPAVRAAAGRGGRGQARRARDVPSGGSGAGRHGPARRAGVRARRRGRPTPTSCWQRRASPPTRWPSCGPGR